jgi:hypothetical protein
MNLGKHALSLAAALALGGALLTFTAGEAEARKRRDNGVRCWQYGGWGGDFTFWVPGEVVTNGDGRKVKCGRDGEWRYVKAG